MNANAIVHLLDDEANMLKALSRLLRSAGHDVRSHSCARDFLKSCQPGETSCLVLDVEMPDVNGLELQRRLNAAGIVLPIIFLTGRGSIPLSVRAIREGAVDFLTKPVDETDLLRAVGNALERAVSDREKIAGSAELAGRLKSLTGREREVMNHVVAGKMNKEIAAELGTGEQNIKIHRSRVMAKMGVQSVADLVRAVERLGSHGMARPAHRVLPIPLAAGDRTPPLQPDPHAVEFLQDA